MTSSSPRIVPLKGLYLILDPSVYSGRNLVDVLVASVEVGVRLFQYRDKQAPMKEAYQLATRLRRASADLGAALMINDRCDLALAVDADGVHLGQRDLPLVQARALMGTEKIIGISTHRLDQVEAATRGGADYIGFGPIFHTDTKADHEPVVGLDGLRQIRARTTLPIFAIGGLESENIAEVKNAGADGVALISAVAKAPDLRTAVRAILAQFA